jgi:hypothetical protein
MSKKVELPGREDSAYGKVTAWMRKAQIYTKSQVIEQFAKLGCNEKAALASAVVMLSPRLSSTRGDCRGNMSNPWGHVAYNAKLAKEKGAEQKFRFLFRKEVLEPRNRVEKIEVSAAKSDSDSAKVTTPPVTA